MRELLGGKGANVAEMTRVLGPDRVPAGFTITTEACVEYMRAGQTEPEGMADAGRRGAGAAGGAHRQAARRPRRPAAGLGPLRRPRVDAGDARHGPQPRPQRRFGRGPWRKRPTTTALPGTPTAGSCRCSATSPAESRASASRTRSRPPRPTASVSDDTELDVDALRELTADVQGDLRRAHRRGVPAGPDRAAAPVDPRRVRLLGRRPGGRVPADQPDPRRLGHGGQRPADGVRQQGRHLGLRGRVHPRRGHRRARAERRLPAQRPGRGRRLRRAHPARHRRGQGLAARRARPADGDPADARAPLPRHAGHRVHGRGRPAVHAADPQRQAPGAGGGAVRGRRRRRRACSRARRRCRRSTPARWTRCCTRRSTPQRVLRRARVRRQRLAGRGQGRDRVHRRRRGRGRARRAAT